LVQVIDPNDPDWMLKRPDLSLRLRSDRCCFECSREGAGFFEKIYAPLTAGLLAPFRADRILAEEKRCQLDRLYQRICDNLDALLREVGLKIAA